MNPYLVSHSGNTNYGRMAQALFGAIWLLNKSPLSQF